MSMVQNLIKRLFPNKMICHHLSDLNNQSLEQKNSKNLICISIEKENRSRQFCSLTVQELITLFEHCPVTYRTLYESIPSNKFVKTYIDFEYLVDKNLDIQNHYIGPISCLKVLFYFLNIRDDIMNTIEGHLENVLKQFLVLDASTIEKISYHFIHASPSILFENTLTLGIFIKAIVHFLLLSIIQHKCSMFNINLPMEQLSILNMIQLLVPYVDKLRKSCTSCQSSIPYVTIADIAYLLVRNKTNEWTTAIDMNVYSRNQQFRLFNSVKYGKNNPLLPSITFPYDSQLKHSFSDLLRKSLITFIENDQISKICFENKRFKIQSSDSFNDKANSTMVQNFINTKLINDYIENSSFFPLYKNISTNQNSSYILPVKKLNSIDLSIPNIQLFKTFVENIITSDSAYQGYIHSCVRGTYNKDLLFFNIGGNYRYCPKRNRHHQRNGVAIMINTKTCTYSIRCKDIDCDNAILSWKKIE